MNIPDQFRVDVWLQGFQKDVAAGTVPALSILWVMDDHTGGPPTPDAEQADNDLAVGRICPNPEASNLDRAPSVIQYRPVRHRWAHFPGNAPQNPCSEPGEIHYGRYNFSLIEDLPERC